MKLLVLVPLLFLVGCPKTEYGPQLTEPATVVDLPFVPSGHGTGVGLSTKGSMVVSSVDIPERYAIVFQCQHGRFVIEDHPDIWKRLRVGQAVTVHYREVIEVENGKRAIVDLDFIDAL
jgi:hypothetical protein